MEWIFEYVLKIGPLRLAILKKKYRKPVYSKFLFVLEYERKGFWHRKYFYTLPGRKE